MWDRIVIIYNVIILAFYNKQGYKYKKRVHNLIKNAYCYNLFLYNSDTGESRILSEDIVVGFEPFIMCCTFYDLEGNELESSKPILTKKAVSKSKFVSELENAPFYTKSATVYLENKLGKKVIFINKLKLDEKLW